MKPWQLARSALSAALANGQIGTACAARLVLLTADHGRLEGLLGEGLTAAAAWFQSAVADVRALGAIQRGHVGLLARFAGGQSALVSAGVSGMAPPRCAAMLVGNHGVLSFEEASDALGLRGPEMPQLSDHVAAEIQTAVRKALDAAAVLPAAQGVSGTAALAAPKPLQPPFGLLLVSGDYTHQPNYAAALLADGRCRLVGVTDEAGLDERRQRLNARLAERLKSPLLPELAAALRRDDVRLVSICAEPERRGPIIRQALAAGKHVYLDKPLAGSLDEARKIAADAARRGLVHHMFSLVHTDYAAACRAAVSAAHQGELGDLLGIHLDLHFAKGHTGGAALGKPRRESAVPTSFELADSKRELTNIGVYPIVQLLWMLRRPIVRVCAATGNYFFAEHQKNNQEDYGQMLLELEGGIVAGISVGRTGWKSHMAGGLSRALLAGSRRSVLLDAAAPRVEAWSDAAPWQPPQRDPDDPMAMWQAPPGSPYIARPKQTWTVPAEAGPNADAAYFLDCVQQGRISDVPATLAAAATEVLMGAYESAASGKTVALPL